MTMVSNERDLDIEREILEAVKAFTSTFGQARFASPEHVYNRTLASTNKFPRTEFGWRVGRLETKGHVKKIGQNVDPDFGFAIQLTDEGEHRLSMPEDEYRKLYERSQAPVVSNTNNIGHVGGNFAQSFGDRSPIAQNAKINPEIASLLGHVLTGIGTLQNVKAEEKEDLANEARQLQLEVSKSSPKLPKIKAAVEVIAPFVPLVTDILKFFQ